MPRNYGRTSTSIWRDKDFLKRTPEARFVYTMLFNQANITACGVLELTVTRWARNTGYSVAVVEEALNELEDHDYVVVDGDTEELLIRSFVKWDGGAGNDLRRRAIRDSASTVGSDRLRAAIAHQLDKMGVEHGLEIPPQGPIEALSEGSQEGVETRRVVVKRVGYENNPQPTTRNPAPCDGALDLEIEAPPRPTPLRPMARFGDFWAAYPRRVGKRAAERRWESLIRAGVDPQAVIDGASRYALEMRGKDAEHVKYPEGWLNAGRWEDEARPAAPPKPSRPSTPWAGA